MKLNKVQIGFAVAEVRMAMRPKTETDSSEVLEAAIADLQREHPHVHVLAKPKSAV